MYRIIKKRVKPDRQRPGFTLLAVARDNGFEYEYWIPDNWIIDQDTILPMVLNGTRAEYETICLYLKRVNEEVAGEAKPS